MVKEQTFVPLSCYQVLEPHPWRRSHYCRYRVEECQPIWQYKVGVVRNQILARHLDSIFEFQFNYSAM